MINFSGWRKRQIALEQKAEKALESKPDYECSECSVGGGHALYCVVCAEKFIAQTETKDEPVAIVISESGANITHSWWHEPALPIGTKLYTSPQRKWVGLTDEEINQGHKDSWVTKQAFESAVWWAEDQLRKKNT
jgi:hypothetical protein